MFHMSDVSLAGSALTTELPVQVAATRGISKVSKSEIELICNCLLSHSISEMLKDWYLRNPQKSEHHFSCNWPIFGFVFDRGCWMFPFPAVEFAVWLMMMDPHFVISNNATQKGIIFLMKLAQKAFTRLQTVMSAVP